MGVYLNPDNEPFASIVANDIYVDKTGLIAYTNNCIGKAKRLIASSRPRRFGKTMAAQMLTAYYSRGCDSKNIFQDLAIARDPSFEKHLNKYDVISLDVQESRSVAIDKIQNGEKITILGFLQSGILKELREAFPDYLAEGETSVAEALKNINMATNRQFVIMIDEWDCYFREEKDNQPLLESYINFLRSLFKGQAANRFVKLAYITGILPIKKYGTQSALNNFRELTMLEPGDITEYIGFTEDEVKSLCKKCDMPFGKMRKWYDGYIFRTEEISYREEDDMEDDGLETGGSEEDDPGAALHVYSPNSVMEAIANRRFLNYWSQTETYESLKIYIEMDFDGLRQKVVDMLGGGRCKVDVVTFQNDMTTIGSSDDVLTLLIHLGYLAYDGKTQEAFIPNEEVRSTFVSAVKSKGWSDVYQAIQDSEKLMKATLAMEEETVAKMIQKVHMDYTASLVYNNEISLASVIQAAYYSSMKDYKLVREMPAGEGFADMAFIPRRKCSKPALLVELKWDESAEGAIAQIHDKKYIEGLKEYKGNLLLVGINYDKKTKAHQCRIEKG